MCEIHESTCNGLGDIWWTDNPIYFSSIDYRVAKLGMLCTPWFRLCNRDQCVPSLIKLLSGDRSVNITKPLMSY